MPAPHPPIRIARLPVPVWRVAIDEPVQNASGSQAARATASIRLEDADGADGRGRWPARNPVPAAGMAPDNRRIWGNSDESIHSLFTKIQP